MVRQVVLHVVPNIRPGLCLLNAQGSLQPRMNGPTVKRGGRSVTIWAAISCYVAGPVITPNCRITANDYMDVLGNQL
jgi:hypothetical protein